MTQESFAEYAARLRELMEPRPLRAPNGLFGLGEDPAFADEARTAVPLLLAMVEECRGLILHTDECKRNPARKCDCRDAPIDRAFARAREAVKG